MAIVRGFANASDADTLIDVEACNGLPILITDRELRIYPVSRYPV